MTGPRWCASLTGDSFVGSPHPRTAAHDQLAEAGADEETLSAVERAVLDRPAVAKAGRARRGTLVEDLSMPPANEVVRLSELRYLLPLLSSGQPAIAHVVDGIAVLLPVLILLRAKEKRGGHCLSEVDESWPSAAEELECGNVTDANVGIC